MKRYGLIGTAYNTGISNIAWGFAENLNMKTLLVATKPFAMFPKRFKNSRLTMEIRQEDIDWLLQDIDVLFTIETPYQWDVYRQAREKGIKTVLMPMIEWLNRSRRELLYIDLFVCPSSYTYEVIARHFPTAKTMQVPCEVPVDLSKFQWRNVEQARVFLHNGGHQGIGGRNSTKELMQAIPLVKSDARFIIRSQFPLSGKVKDPRITYLEGNVENYWDLYEKGDVWLMPWKYGVAACGLQESMASGMIPVITDMKPFNEFMPKELLLKPSNLTWKKIHAGQEELYAEHSPQLIAEKIDELYNTDIRQLRSWAKQTAHDWSWEAWKPQYIEAFDSL